MAEAEVTSTEGSRCISTYTISVVVFVISIYIYRRINRRIKKGIWKAAGKNVVLVHCPSPGFFTPNVSPFVMKLLTYLRLAKIPYKLDHAEPMGEKGKTPWITVNGEDLYDSQLIMEALAQKYNKNFSSNLTEQKKAVSRAFANMIEDHLAWGLRVWRFNVDNGRNLLEGMKHPFYVALLKPFFIRSQRQALWHQGLGRHTHAEVEEEVTKDLRAISNYLGRNPYFMGDKLSEVDCTVFAFVANILYNYNRSPYYNIIKEEFPNLYDYVIRVKGKLWPDWNKCLAVSKR